MGSIVKELVGAGLESHTPKGDGPKLRVRPLPCIRPFLFAEAGFFCNPE